VASTSTTITKNHLSIARPGTKACH